MTQRINRQGKATVTSLFLIATMLLLSILMVGWYTARSVAGDNTRLVVQRGQPPRVETKQVHAPAQTRHVQAQQFQTRQLQTQQIPTQQFQNQQIPTQRNQSRTTDPYLTPSPLGGSVQYRPVYETEYREKTSKFSVPQFDPETGKTTMREQEQVLRYPVTTTRWVKTYTSHSGSAHNQKATQLAAELREIPEDDESREAKLNQLREQLELAFKDLHSQQLVQIERTEQRLESLKKLHDQRGENKKNIVDRRIDELLGKVDPLGWNPAPIHSPQALSKPATGITVPGQPLRSVSPTHNRYGFPAASQNAPGAFYTPSPIGVPGPPHVPKFTPANPLQTKTPRVRAFPPSPNDDGPNTSAGDLGEAKLRVQEVEVESEVDSEPDVAQTSRSTTRVQVAAPRSALGEVFHLARSLADANAELAAAEMEYRQHEQLRSKGAIPIFEFQKLELKFNKSKRDVKLINMQLDALTEAMERVQKVAKSMLRRTELNLNAVMVGHSRGTHSDQDLASARFEVEKAKIELADATANLEKLSETMATVKAFDTENTKANSQDESQGDADKSVDTANGTATQKADQHEGR